MMLVGLTIGWSFTNVGAVADPLAAAYATPLAMVGALTTALFLAHGVMQFPSGRAADRFGARPVILTALGLELAGSALALPTAEPAVAICGRAVTGLGTGLAFVAASDYLRVRGGSAVSQGAFGGSVMAGGALALAFVPLLENAMDWRAPYLSAGSLAAIALAAVLMAPGTRPAGLHRDLGRLSVVARDRSLLPLAAVHMGSLGIYTVLFVWLVTLLERAGGYSNETAGAVTAVALATAIAARPFGGWLIRRRPDRIRGLLAASVTGGALSTLALVPAQPLALVTLAAAIMGLAAGIGFAPVLAEVARLRPDAPAAAVGWVHTLGNSASIVGTPLFGLAFSLPGDGRIAFVIGALLWAAPLGVLYGRISPRLARA